MLSRTLGDLLKTGVALRPDALAVTDGKREAKFWQLENAAFHVASILRDTHHLPPAGRVMVIASKRTAIVAAALGIWKAGGIYVPVDEATPEGRLDHLLDSIEPFLLIADEKWLQKQDNRSRNLKTLSFETIDLLFDRTASKEAFFQKTFSSTQQIHPEETAYILHTSGSTGRPKGVMMSHQAVLAYFAGHNEILDFKPGDMCLNNAPFHFDVSIQDTFLPLSFGAGVVLTPGMKIGALLLRQMERHKVTHLIAVATILTLIASDEERLKSSDLQALRVVMTGAEICHVDMINRWFEVNPAIRVINGYGPTEVNSISVVQLIEAPDTERTTAYPIGRPLRTVRLRLEDEKGKAITLPDQRGELLLAGPQMMQGYWRNEEATRKVLVQREGETWYKTGDLCHFNNAMELVFDGRKDAEVKIAGRRIHLGEIRSLMESHMPEASTAVKVLQQGQSQIITALVSSGNKADYHPPAPDFLQNLDAFLKRELPPYMVPGLLAFCPRDALLNSNGKLDISALLEQILDLSLLSSERLFIWRENRLEAARQHPPIPQQESA